MPTYSQLRIAFFSPQLPSVGGSNGIITYTRIMRDALRDLGHLVMVVSPTQVEHFDYGINDLPQPGLRHRFLDRHHQDSSGRILNAFEVAKAAGAQVFEIEESFGWARRLRGIPIVVRLHGPNSFNPDVFDKDREAAEIASLSKASAVTSPATALLEAIRSHFNIELPHATVIPNPMRPPLERWSVEKADLDQVLFVGRFDRCKGADIALEAFSKARIERPELRMVMVGPGEPWGDLPCGVTVLGTQPPERIAELRLQSGLALSCSRSEAFSYAVAEAMAIGMPVVATETFGPSEIIRDGIDGRLVPVANAEMTAKVMLKMLSDTSELIRMGQSAAFRVGDYMSPGRIAEETAKLYSQLCYSRRSAA